mgnify:CR=1 FL=1
METLWKAAAIVILTVILSAAIGKTEKEIAPSGVGFVLLVGTPTAFIKFVISLMIVAALGVVQLPLVMVNFDGLSLMQYLKLSLVMGFKDLLSSAIQKVQTLKMQSVSKPKAN